MYFNHRGLATRKEVRQYVCDRVARDMKVLNATRKRRESKDVEGQLVLPELDIPLPD